MARFSKEERKARRKNWQRVERADLVAAMPMTPQQFNSLLDYLTANLTACDHTTKLTVIFLHVEKLDKDRVLSWLRDHGGFCDCEVLYNLEDLAASFQEEPVPPVPRPKRKRTARSLATATGWDLTKLPKPWRIGNLYSPDMPLQLQMGKKGGCSIAVFESSLPNGDQDSDEYWSQQWYSRTELPERSPIHVTRDTLGLSRPLRSILVQSPSWLPVFCWIVPDEGEWYIEVKTEFNRQKGDLPQVASLINQLTATKT